VYEYNGCYWHGHPFQPFRDVPTVAGDTLAERYEKSMTRLDQITQAGYQVEVQRECDFDERILAAHPELQTHHIVEHQPLITRNTLYEGRTEALRLHYKITEGETIQYVDVMSLHPYICKYLKFPISHPVSHVGDECQDMQAMLEKDCLMKCSILPPRQLYHSVLPLLFCLCRSCAIQRIETTTARTKRMLKGHQKQHGLWMSFGCSKKGYKLVDVQEVYEYQVTK
jgi:hypothetical protein